MTDSFTQPLTAIDPFFVGLKCDQVDWQTLGDPLG
jgi:hypothetical protein